MTKQWKVRPSEFYGITDPLSGYYFDRAVTTFGLALEAELHEAGSKAKTAKKAEQARQRVLNDWLEIGQQKFRDPASTSEAKKAPEITSGQSGAVSL